MRGLAAKATLFRALIGVSKAGLASLSCDLGWRTTFRGDEGAFDTRAAGASLVG